MNSQLEKLKKKREQLDARIKAAAAREKEQERKDRTRALILTGSGFLEFLKRNPEYGTQLMSRVIQHVAEKDRELVSRFFEQLKQEEKSHA